MFRHYVRTLYLDIVSDGYPFKSKNNAFLIYMNNVFYCHAPVQNGLFVIDLVQETHIHNTDAKHRNTNELNTIYLWHCGLGHIGRKRMKKLHRDGLLTSFDFESYDTCEACLMGKMARASLNGVVERATDLLEIIHTDVCGPMSIPSRGGFLYFITFTDD